MEEYDYLWYVLKRIPFYEQNRYSYEIPDHKVFHEMARRAQGLPPPDDEAILSTFISEVYDARFFNAEHKHLKVNAKE